HVGDLRGYGADVGGHGLDALPPSAGRDRGDLCPALRRKHGSASVTALRLRRRPRRRPTDVGLTAAKLLADNLAYARLLLRSERGHGHTPCATTARIRKVMGMAATKLTCLAP